MIIISLPAFLIVMFSFIFSANSCQGLPVIALGVGLSTFDKASVRILAILNEISLTFTVTNLCWISKPAIWCIMECVYEICLWALQYANLSISNDSFPNK
jgi:hypothetical protein